MLLLESNVGFDLFPKSLPCGIGLLEFRFHGKRWHLEDDLAAHVAWGVWDSVA